MQNMCMCVYIYIHMCVYIYTHMCVYIHTHIYMCVCILGQGFPCGSADKESTCNAGDLGLIPGWEDPLEKGKATHSQYSDLENSTGLYSP